MKKRIIISLLLLSALQVNSQDGFSDSLQKRLSSATQAIERFDLLHQMAESRFRGVQTNIDSLCLQMLSIAQDEQNDSLLAISYNWLGNYFSWTGDYKNALEYFVKGVPLAKKAGDKRRLSSLFIDISFIQHSIGDYDEEYKYLQLAANNLPDPSSPLFAFMDIQVKSLLANHYVQKSMPDSALKYTQAANEIQLQLKTDFFPTMIYPLFGAIYEKLGDTALADGYYKKGIAVLDKNVYLENFRQQRLYYIGFLIRTQQFNEARVQAHKMLKVSKELNKNELALAAAESLHSIFSKQENTDSAYYYLKLQLALKDTLFSLQRISRIQSLAFTEQLRMREEELKNKKMQEQRELEIQFMMIGIGILILSVLFLLLSHSILANEAVIRFIGIVSLLVLFEFLNLVLHPFLGEITHHSPLLMLLIMVCIAALLVPLHHRLEKWITHRMVEKNKRIRLAAAKRTIEKLEKNN